MSSLEAEATSLPDGETPGSLLNAWVAVALHPSRSLVALWASFAAVGWILASFLLTASLFGLAGVAARFRNAGLLEYLLGFPIISSPIELLPQLSCHIPSDISWRLP
jgi:hypothetical protein